MEQRPLMRLVRQWPLHERQVLPLRLGRHVLQISSYPEGIAHRVMVANFQDVPIVDFTSAVDRLQVTGVIPVPVAHRGMVEVHRAV
ncbi:MAG: hypothetical protein GY772_11110, partial [bacterium]|nr:hypothetical protein [bacterium]